MKVLCTICARGGSKGVKNKNIRLLSGKPLIAHSIIQAKNTALFDMIAVSSDSVEIRDIAMQWGADAVIERPVAMASDTAAKLPAIQHAVLAAEKIHGEPFDYIIDLDATSPLRSVEDIVAAFTMLITHKTAKNLVTACPARRSPYFNMLELDENGFTALVKPLKEGIVRRQDAPRCFDMNASIYIWSREALFYLEKIITDQTILYVMPEERSIDIDSPADWDYVNFLAKKRKDL